MTESQRVIRVVLTHPGLPKYRIPVFRELARRPGIRLKVVYSHSPNLPNVPADGFEAQPATIRERQIAGQVVYWEQSQWDYARADRADVLVMDWNARYLSEGPALLRARLNGVGTVLWGHGRTQQEVPWRRWMRQRLARLATSVVFYNHTAAQAYLDAGWDPRRIHVAINSLDQSPIQAARTFWLSDPRRLESFRRERGLGAGPIVLFVSRLDPANRVDWLIEAAGRLPRTHPDLQIAIIGIGQDEPRLRALANSLGLANRVHFAGAIYDETQLAPWFLSASAFCYPTNVGLSILHAFGYGVPIVTSDRLDANNPEIEALTPDENGLTFRDADPADLANTLARLIADPTLFRRLSEAALQTVRERFTLQKMVDGLESAIRHASMTSARNADKVGEI